MRKFIITKTTITMTKESKVTMLGRKRNANRKEVLCITDGTLYASVADTAEAIGVTEGAVSQNLTGLTKTCTGKRFCYAKEIIEHLGDIAESMQAKEQEIADLRRELEMYRDLEAEHNRRKAEHDRAVAEAQAIYYQRMREFENAKSLLAEAEAQMNELEEEEF